MRVLVACCQKEKKRRSADLKATIRYYEQPSLSCENDCRNLWPINQRNCVAVGSTPGTMFSAKKHFYHGFCVHRKIRSHAENLHVHTSYRMQCENSRALCASKLKAHVCEFSSQSSDFRGGTTTKISFSRFNVQRTRPLVPFTVITEVSKRWYPLHPCWSTSWLVFPSK